MVGPASLRTKKALLTRYCNNLSRVIEKVDSAQTTGQASSDDASSSRIKASLFELDTTAKLGSEALNAFTAALDEIDELPEEQETQTKQKMIERAHQMAIELDAKNIGNRVENEERGLDNHPPLPDSRQIALKRLQGAMRTLKSSPRLLEDYKNTLRTQLEKGIIELIPNDQPGIGPIVHYIPDQAVITPKKKQRNYGLCLTHPYTTENVLPLMTFFIKGHWYYQTFT
ncbi:hypothetical protein NECAME_13366 [Necator americanus]|uniref:Uncharacterized protein n=1 Tax=Necator americanus TaxID=51031 RepID=W2SYY8_NECAM|nr:hypothetical protein NECAME_13366 [Necator americanus]ETN73877.1 hypothetical protein NECAME_13366 [Necator americanus]